MGEPFTSDFKITTSNPSFLLHNPDHDDNKMKAHSSSKFTAPFYWTYIKNCFLVTDTSNITPKNLSASVISALQGVRFIAQHIRDADKDNEVRIMFLTIYLFFLIASCLCSQ